MNKSTTMHWRRLGVLCLIFVLLISSTAQATTNTRVWIDISTELNNVFEFNTFEYGNIGETFSLSIKELRNDVHIDHLNIYNSQTGTTTLIDVSELDNPSPGNYKRGYGNIFNVH